MSNENRSKWIDNDLIKELETTEEYKTWLKLLSSVIISYPCNLFY